MYVNEQMQFSLLNNQAGGSHLCKFVRAVAVAKLKKTATASIGHCIEKGDFVPPKAN